MSPSHLERVKERDTHTDREKDTHRERERDEAKSRVSYDF